MVHYTLMTSRFIVVAVLILTLCHQTSGGGSWNRLERLFVQDHHRSDQWDQNRIIFPDETEDSTKSSWRSTTTPRHEDTRRACQDSCKISREYSPICGTNGVTYQNMDQLQCDMKCGVDVNFHRRSACSSNFPTIRTTAAPTFTTTSDMTPVTSTQRDEEVEQCIRKCPSTPEYNPVCGTNHVTYPNIGKLRCAKICGVDVSLWRHAPCPTTRTTTTTAAPTTSHDRDDVIQECITTCPTTPEYNPVCGTDDVTYQNIGKLECAKFCGVHVSVQNTGRCAYVPHFRQPDKDTTTSDEDYGEDHINPRFHPRDQRKYYWT